MKLFNYFIVALISVSLGFGLQQLELTSAQSILDLQRESDAADMEDAELLGCAKGWRQFLSSLIGYQGFEEYVQEIFETNLCYRTDLEAVRSQVDKARRVVRSTFLRCETERLDQATKSYYKLEAELYFLHNMIEQSYTNNPESQGKVLDRIRDPAKLQALASEMKQFFVVESGFLTEELLQDYIAEFATKYRARVLAYETCRTDYYQELGDKWNELIENFRNFGEVFDGPTEREKQRDAARESDDDNPSTRDGPLLKIEDDLDLNFKIARLKVEPEKSFQDLVTTITKQPDTVQKPMGLSHDLAPTVIKEETARVNEELSRAELEARFEVLYAEMSDLSVRDINEKMDDWITAVNNTIPVLEQIESCVDEVEDKQCK